jgi:hypothetical protein
MSDEPAKPAQPAPQPAPQPAATPPAPAATPQGEFHFLVVPDTGDIEEPRWETAASLADLLSRLHEALVECKLGWCYVIVNGKRCLLSRPRQFFELKMPDGNIVRVEPKGEAVFAQDGRYAALVPPTQD